MPTRRDALRLTLGAAMVPAFGWPALGQQGRAGAPPGRPQQSGPLEVDVSDANLRPRPIAMPTFLSQDPQLGQDVAAIVAADLESSGLFQPLDPRSFIERIGDTNSAAFRRLAFDRCRGADGRAGRPAE